MGFTVVPCLVGEVHIRVVQKVANRVSFFFRGQLFPHSRLALGRFPALGFFCQALLILGVRAMLSLRGVGLRDQARAQQRTDEYNCESRCSRKHCWSVPLAPFRQSLRECGPSSGDGHMTYITSEILGQVAARPISLRRIFLHRLENDDVQIARELPATRSRLLQSAVVYGSARSYALLKRLGVDPTRAAAVSRAH